MTSRHANLTTFMQHDTLKLVDRDTEVEVWSTHDRHLHQTLNELCTDRTTLLALLKILLRTNENGTVVRRDELGLDLTQLMKNLGLYDLIKPE